LNPAVVADDKACELGKWLICDGRAHSSLPEYTNLITDHARFYKAASEVIRKADSGQNVTEEVVIGGKSEFAAASTGVVQAIMSLKNKIKA
jgi:hypothetical protein